MPGNHRRSRDAVEPSHVYTIPALLPVEADRRPRYRIRSSEENFERVVTEELRSRFNQAARLPNQSGIWIPDCLFKRADLGSLRQRE